MLYYAAQFAPLQTLNWLVTDMFGYIVFAAIVLFQADIRHALAHFGRAPFFRYLSRPETTRETIEEVVVALRMLADAREGAIIAIEREIGLRNYVESGIPLDAAVSYDLLVSVFRPASPLHDGAVIIQQDRIACGRVFSTADDQPSDQQGPGLATPRGYRIERGDRCRCPRCFGRDRSAVAGAGWRDRAGSRARTAAVSARGADVASHRTSDADRSKAGRMMAVPLLRDLGLKVFATALAVLLWLTVAGDPIAERGLHVPLGFENIPDSMVILGGAPETVEVRVRGSSAVLRRLEVGEGGGDHRSGVSASREPVVRYDGRFKSKPRSVSK